MDLPSETIKHNRRIRSKCFGLILKSTLNVVCKIKVIRAKVEQIRKPSAERVAMDCILIGKKARKKIKNFKNGMYLIQK